MLPSGLDSLRVSAGLRAPGRGSGAGQALEGAAPAGRVVVIQFPSLKAAQDSWNDPAYQALVPIRQKSSTSRIFLVEGLPQ